MGLKEDFFRKLHTKRSSILWEPRLWKFNILFKIYSCNSMTACCLMHPNIFPVGVTTTTKTHPGRRHLPSLAPTTSRSETSLDDGAGKWGGWVPQRRWRWCWWEGGYRDVGCKPWNSLLEGGKLPEKKHTNLEIWLKDDLGEDWRFCFWSCFRPKWERIWN